jgi:hypothetical protein
LTRTAPLASSSLLDPVDALASLRDSNPPDPAVPELRVSTSQASTGYLAMAVLDNYDGGLWSFDTTFQPTGGRVPAPTGPPTGVIGLHPVRQQETLLGPPVLPLLPALDRPITVNGVATAADAATGMLVSTHALGPGTTYSVVSSAPTMTLAQVAPADGIERNVASATPTAASSADLTLPPSSTTALATVLRFLSGLTGQRPAPTVAFLQAVVHALHSTERRIDPTLRGPATPPQKPSGKKVPRTTTTTTVPASNLAAAGATSLSEVINEITFSRIGTPEQFATMLAMVARYVGIPARLVTGYRVAADSTGALIPAGTYRITNRQAWAWVEVPVAGLGWVVVDPTPDTGAANRRGDGHGHDLAPTPSQRGTSQYGRRACLGETVHPSNPEVPSHPVVGGSLGRSGRADRAGPPPRTGPGRRAPSAPATGPTQ